MAAWFTPETTYLAIAYELNWTKEYYGFQPGTVLVDNATGKKYKLRKVQGLPMKDLFFIHGVAGDMFAMVLEFEPLPISTIWKLMENRSMYGAPAGVVIILLTVLCLCCVRIRRNSNIMSGKLWSNKNLCPMMVTWDMRTVSMLRVELKLGIIPFLVTWCFPWRSNFIRRQNENDRKWPWPEMTMTGNDRGNW